MHSSIDDDGTQQDPKLPANSRPNTTPRFVRLQRRRIPRTAKPRTNRAIATAISQERIDHRRLEAKRNADGTAASCANEPQSPTPYAPESPSVVRRRPKHSSMFHVKQMYFYGSKTDILHNTLHFTHRLALLHRACPTPFAQSFPNHITSSAHQPTLSMRDKLPLTQTPTTDNRPLQAATP